MPIRLTLISHGRTMARPSTFPGDEPLAEGEAARIAALPPQSAPITSVLSSPARAALQTVEALALEGDVEPRLADLDLGRWRGKAMAAIEEGEPGALAHWMNDPHFTGHGGESRAAVALRVAGWLEDMRAAEGHILAITHPAIIQALMLRILGGAPEAFRNIDVLPLHELDLRSDGSRWTIRSFGRP